MPLAKQATVIDWNTGRRPDMQAIVESTMWHLGHELAIEYGLTLGEIESDGEMIPAPSDDDIAKALRTPLPVAVVLAEIARDCALEIPSFVVKAMDACEDLPWVNEGRPPGLR